MTTYNTRNPVPSGDARDRFDNSQTFDEVINGTFTYYVNRKGANVMSLKGMETLFNAAQLARANEYAAGKLYRDTTYTADKLARDTEFAEDQAERETTFVETQADKEARFVAFLLSSGYELIGDYDADGPLTVSEINEIFTKDGELWRAKANLVLPYTTVNNWATDAAKFVSVGDAALRQELGFVTGPEKIGFGQGGVSAVNGTLADALATLPLSPERFGANPDGTDASANFLKCINAAILQKRPIKLAAGAEYLISSALSVTLTAGQAVEIQFNGGRLKQAGNNTVLSITNDPGNIVAVSSIEEVSYNLGNGATNTRVMKVIAPGHGLTAIGQEPKIFSDDIVPDFDQSNQFCGEWFTVGAIESADVFYTSGVFQESYATNVKLCNPSNARVKFVDGHVKSEINDAITASLVTVSGFRRNDWGKFKAEDPNSSCLNNTGNLNAICELVIGTGGKNRPDLGAYCYYFNDSASQGTLVTIDCSGGRHGYTTTTPSAVAGDNKPHLRGRTWGATVQGRAIGMPNGFDTHSPAHSITFLNPQPIDDYRGNDTGGAGVQIRGRNCRVINPNLKNCKIGIGISGASKTGDSETTIDGLSGEFTNGAIAVVSSGSPTYKTKVKLRGAGMKSLNANVFSMTNTELSLVNVDCDWNPTVNGGNYVELYGTSSVKGRGGVVTIGTGTGHKLVSHEADATKAYVDDLQVVGAARLSYLAASAAQYTAVESRFKRIQLDAGLPGVPFLGFPVGAKAACDVTVGFGSKPFGYRAITYGASGNQALDTQFAGDANLFFRITAGVADVAINSITAGAFQGQRATINNHSGSASTLNLKANSGGLLAIGTTRVIPVGGSTWVDWDGSNWR